MTDKRQLRVAKMRMLRWMCDITRIDKIRNERKRKSLKFASVTKTLKIERLTWYGHVIRQNESNISQYYFLNMNIEG